MDPDEDYDPTIDDGINWRGNEKITKANNTLELWGNKDTMNMNSLILDNVRNSPYFKNTLYAIHTYHEILDEIYYNVNHLEPWEKGSRRMAGTTGARAMEVRGVSSGGIVSTAYCILYKLFCMKITRKQVYGLVNYEEAPYIRGIGFLYLRYTQAPKDLWDWFSTYFDDTEKVDPRAGGGDEMTVGQMTIMMLKKLDWYSTLFPRIPVPVQKEIEQNFREYYKQKADAVRETAECQQMMADSSHHGQVEAAAADSSGRPSSAAKKRSRSRERVDRGSRHRSRDRPDRGNRSQGRKRSRERDRHVRRASPNRRDRRSRSRDRDRKRRRSQSGSRKRKDRSRSRSKHEKKHRRRSLSKSREKKRRERSRSRSKRSKRSRERDQRSRSKSVDSQAGKELPKRRESDANDVSGGNDDLAKYDLAALENEKPEANGKSEESVKVEIGTDTLDSTEKSTESTKAQDENPDSSEKSTKSEIIGSEDPDSCSNGNSIDVSSKIPDVTSEEKSETGNCDNGTTSDGSIEPKPEVSGLDHIFNAETVENTVESSPEKGEIRSDGEIDADSPMI